jgi:hypothetical protein
MKEEEKCEGEGENCGRNIRGRAGRMERRNERIIKKYYFVFQKL